MKLLILILLFGVTESPTPEDILNDNFKGESKFIGQKVDWVLESPTTSHFNFGAGREISVFGECPTDSLLIGKCRVQGTVSNVGSFVKFVTVDEATINPIEGPTVADMIERLQKVEDKSISFAEFLRTQWIPQSDHKEAPALPTP